MNEENSFEKPSNSTDLHSTGNLSKLLQQSQKLNDIGLIVGQGLVPPTNRGTMISPHSNIERDESSQNYENDTPSMKNSSQ